MTRLRGLLPVLGPAAILGLVLVAAAALEPAFFSASNLRNLARLSSFLVVVSLGQLVVVISRGLDLSVGAVITTTLLLVVELTGGDDDRVLVAVGATLLAATAVGLVNGFMVAVRGVPAILATLATFTLVGGLSLYLTGGRAAGPVPDAVKPLGVGNVLGIPVPVLIATGCAVVVWGLLARTTAGRVLYATGANAVASRLSGIAVRRVGVLAFVGSALLAAIAGLMLSGYVGFYDRTLGVGYDLDSIAAVVLGGAALTGGRGRVGGTVLAAIGLASLDNLLLVMGAADSLQLIWKATVLLAAVLSAQWLFTPSDVARVRPMPTAAGIAEPSPRKER
ncbi:MAG: ABC transporter permease [Actinomycetota bacterium]